MDFNLASFGTIRVSNMSVTDKVLKMSKLRTFLPKILWVAVILSPILAGIVLGWIAGSSKL